MFEIVPAHVATIIALALCLVGLGLLANRLDKRAKQRRASNARREHLERLQRLRQWSTQRPPSSHAHRNPGPGLRPHPVFATQAPPRPWVIPPAEMAEPARMAGVGDSFDSPGADTSIKNEA